MQNISHANAVQGEALKPATVPGCSEPVAGLPLALQLAQHRVCVSLHFYHVPNGTLDGASNGISLFLPFKKTNKLPSWNL